MERIKSAADVWIPLDISLQLPWHKTQDRIPATFEPKGKQNGNSADFAELYHYKAEIVRL